LLLEKGYFVRVLDTFMFGKEPIAEFIKHKNFTYIEGDATNIVTITKAMQQIDTVIHLAGLVGDPACAVDSDLTVHSNVITARLAKDVAIASGVQRFIFASSCSVYGVNENVVDEKMEFNPVSLYAKTKISTENELLRVSVDDFHPTILRFATVFGHSSRQRFDLVGNLFAAQAFNNKVITVMGADQWRPFVHVKDLARAICCVIEAPVQKVAGEIFNVGDDDFNRTIKGLSTELATAYESVFGEPVAINYVEMNPTDKRNYRVSFDKIRRTLGFRCKTTFNQGFIEILNNFKNGAYGDFNDRRYSNVAVTRELSANFGSPEHASGIYTSLKILRNEEVN
jgi:nucleoside-diphosphate-sugar epimerase